MSDSKTLYIIRGVSGSGKSSLGKALAPRAVVSADDMPGLYVDGKYQIELQAASHDWSQNMVREFMIMEEKKIAVCNTFCKQKYFRPYLDLALRFNYFSAIVQAEVILNPALFPLKNIHDVPEEVIHRQIHSYEPYPLAFSPASPQT